MQLTSATDRAGLVKEQAALRRVATLVAEQPSPQEVFTAVTEAVGRLLGADLAAMHVFPGDGTATTIAGWSGAGQMLPIGTRLPLDGDSVAARIFHTGAPARIDSYVGIEGETADVARGLHLRSAVGAPILVGGRLWGALMAATRSVEPLPEDAERRIAAFTELVATAIANAEARRELERVAGEQQALRRAATLVASGASPMEVFAAITTSASELFEVPFASLLRYGPDETATMVAGCAACSRFVGQTWTVPGDDPGVVRTVVGSRRPARIEDHSGVHGPLGEAARSLGIGSVVGVPVIVDGSVWGVLAVGAAQDGPPLPPDASDRLIGFTELVTTTLINAETREGLRRLADEQAALRRVATLVARRARPDEIFAAVSDEVGKVCGGEVAIARFEPDGSGMVVVGLSQGIPVVSIGTRWPLEEFLASTKVYRTGRPARNDHTGHQTASGLVADSLRKMSYVSTVAAPIVVEGDLWGVVTVSDRRTSLPPDTEERVEKFTELVGTAIANAQSRGELAASEERARELAEEQTALRRVATLVAEGVPPQDLFAVMAEEVANVCDAQATGIARYEGDGTATEVASFLRGSTGGLFRPGVRLNLDGRNILQLVRDSSEAARIDDYSQTDGELAETARRLGIKATVGTPIVVAGRLWGAMLASTTEPGPLPEDTASRMSDFTQLLATAIENVESREAVERMAEEQAALRRVATLVAEGATPTSVFEAVRDEVARMFDIPSTVLMRFGGDGMATLLATYGDYLGAAGTRWPLEGDSSAVARVHQTGHAARADYTRHVHGSLAQAARRGGVRYPVAVPVVVEGALWGAMSAGSSGPAPPPADLEGRLAKFTELLAAAIANAGSRAALAASEARKSGILEWALDCIITIDHEGKILEFNPAAEATFRYRREEVLGKEMAELIIPPSLREQHYRGLERYLETGEGPVMRKRVELKGLRSDGTEFPVELTITPITVGDLPMFTAYMRDISDRKRGEKERARLLRGERAARAEAEAASERAQDLAREQAALRRVATLVAEGAKAEEVFSAVAREVGLVLGVRVVSVDRYESDGTSVFSVVLASLENPRFPVGSRWPLDGPSVRASIYETGRPARIQDWSGLDGTVAAAMRNQGMRWALGVPIVVDGAVWGNICAGTTEGEPVPDGAEERLARFTELVSTSVTNTTMRGELAASEARARELASEQAALRRVATLVAQGASPDALFSTVAAEVARIIDIPIVRVHRFEADGTFTVVGIAGETNFTVGSRWPVPEDGIAGMILTTGRPGHKNDYSTMRGPLGDALREDLTTSTVGVPIVVEGSIWGFMVAAGRPGRPIPPDTEERLARFTELVATAVSNATTRTDLLTSRTRLVSTADETRRRLERDLHDGIQQWLVALALRARKAAGLFATGESPVQELAGLADDLVAVTDELREISRGIHPAILSDAGLDDALEALARRSAIRVDLDVSFQGRYDPTLEATVYYVAAESITNAVKHAQASTIAVRGGLRDGAIELEIRDDGVGGADPRRGTGMTGLKDRVDTLGGTISFASPAGAGTTIRVRLPAGLTDERA